LILYSHLHDQFYRAVKIVINMPLVNQGLASSMRFFLDTFLTVHVC